MKKLLKLEPQMWIEYGAAAVLFIANIITACSLPYYTEHKYYYDSLPYIVVLILAFAVYTVYLLAARKKSTSDIAIVLFGFFLLWEVSYKLGFVRNDLLIPSPEGLFHLFTEKQTELLTDIWSSLKLLFWGVVLASVFGTMLGLLAGWIARVREVLLPISNVVSLIPPLMFSAYLIMLLPTFRQAAIAVIFMAVFWPVFRSTTEKVGQIDHSIIEAARTMGVGTIGMLFKVIFPYCLPGIIQSISGSLRGAFMCLSGAEMLGINLGIGYFIEKYRSFSDFRCVLAGIVVVAGVTTIISILMNRFQKAIIHWEY